MKLLVSLLLTLCLSACAGNSTKPLITPHQQIEAVCLSISASYGVAATANNAHPFSAATQDKLRAAAAKTDVTCAHIPNRWADVVPGFSDAAKAIDLIAKGGNP